MEGDETIEHDDEYTITCTPGEEFTGGGTHKCNNGDLTPKTGNDKLTCRNALTPAPPPPPPPPGVPSRSNSNTTSRKPAPEARQRPGARTSTRSRINFEESSSSCRRLSRKCFCRRFKRQNPCIQAAKTIVPPLL